MTFEEYSIRMDSLIKDLQAGAHAYVMADLAMDAIAMIKNRIIQNGYNAKGVPFAQVPVKSKNPHTDYTKGYKNYKKKAGKYRGFVDFSFSTRMWNNIKLMSSEAQLQKGIAKITASTTEDQKKLNANTEQRGNILELSDFERERLLKIYDQKLLNIFRKNGL